MDFDIEKTRAATRIGDIVRIVNEQNVDAPKAFEQQVLHNCVGSLQWAYLGLVFKPAKLLQAKAYKFLTSLGLVEKGWTAKIMVRSSGKTGACYNSPKDGWIRSKKQVLVS
jgi:hypothetical protein